MSEEQRRDEPFDARAEREKGLPANYGGAEVALAVLRYRPGKKREQRREENARDEATRASRDGQESNGR